MSSRVYPKLTTTSIPPADSKLGDQYYDPVANQLYELLPVNGTSVRWVQIIAVGGSPSGYLANSVIFANSAGYLSNTSNLQFFASNNALILSNGVITPNTTSAALEVTSTSTELTLQQTGDLYGTTALRLQNRNGLNGALFDSSLGSAALVDFAFKTVNAQQNIRFETRGGGGNKFITAGDGNEFQFGTPGSPSLITGYTGILVYPKTISTSNLTGALLVNGGAGITGNVYSGGLYITGSGNGITFVDGTIQTTAGSSVANTIYLSGVQTTQNANITAAFVKANTGVANIGPVITVNSAGYLFVSNTTVSTSNTTGALVVSGGVGVAGNVYIGGTANLSLGTSTSPPISFNGGSTLLTTQSQGAHEYDGTALYISANTSNGSGRMIIHSSQYANLTSANAASVASGAVTFFGGNNRPYLVQNHMYHIKYHLSFQKATTGTVTFSFSNSTSVNFVPLIALVTIAPNGGLAANTISIYANGATTTTSTASASLTGGTGYTAFIDGTVMVASNTRLQLVLTDSAGTVTANTGSIFLITDLGINASSGNLA